MGVGGVTVVVGLCRSEPGGVLGAGVSVCKTGTADFGASTVAIVCALSGEGARASVLFDSLRSPKLLLPFWSPPSSGAASTGAVLCRSGLTFGLFPPFAETSLNLLAGDLPRIRLGSVSGFKVSALSDSLCTAGSGGTFFAAEVLGDVGTLWI